MFAAPTKENACVLALPSLPVSAGYWSVESTGLIYDCPQVRSGCLLACCCLLPLAHVLQRVYPLWILYAAFTLCCAMP